MTGSYDSTNNKKYWTFIYLFIFKNLVKREFIYFQIYKQKDYN